jgi:hypothetical protein
MSQSKNKPRLSIKARESRGKDEDVQSPIDGLPYASIVKGYHGRILPSLELVTTKAAYLGPLTDCTSLLTI